MYWASEVMACLGRYEAMSPPAKPQFLDTPEEIRAAKMAVWRSDREVIHEHNRGNALTVEWAMRIFEKGGEPKMARHLESFLRQHYPDYSFEQLAPLQESMGVG